MFHPVGSHTPNVYWRRRLLLAAFAIVVVVLAVLTWRTLTGEDVGGQPAAGVVPATTATSTTPGSADRPSPADGTGTASSSPSPAKGSATRPAKGSTRTAEPSLSGSGSGTASGTPACTAARLSVRAVVGQAKYSVDARPLLSLEVTNTGSAACVQDVADSQIVLRVYNGAARVWSSHDCGVTPGKTERTLEPGRPARYSVTWTGYTSQPRCAGPRQHVGAGVYTLYASLSGEEGTAAQFTMS